MSQIRINGIKSLEITCFGFHCIAISTKMIEIKYSDLYNFKWFKEVCDNLRFLIPEYDQSSALLAVSCQNVIYSLLASLLTLLFAAFVVIV